MYRTQQILYYRENLNSVEVNAFYIPWKNALGTQNIFLFKGILEWISNSYEVDKTDFSSIT